MWGMKTCRFFLFIVLFLVMTGCAGNRQYLFEPPLPENIYYRPLRNYYSHAHVGVFCLGSPQYAPAVGASAGHMLHQTLMGKKLFRRVSPLFQHEYISLDRQMEIARKHRLDLMIGGNVLYYLEGSLSQASRVDIEISVWDVTTGMIVWHARASELGAPSPSSDYFLIQTRGKPAPGATALMAKNVDKIIRMIQTESSAYKDMSEDMQLVDSGYFHMARGEFNKAKPYLQRAVQVAPRNVHALFNLAMVQEETGDVAAAAKLYEKVLALHSRLVLGQVTGDDISVYSLVMHAKKRLAILKVQEVR